MNKFKIFYCDQTIINNGNKTCIHSIYCIIYDINNIVRYNRTSKNVFIWQGIIL